MSVKTKGAVIPLALSTAMFVSACGESTSSDQGSDFGKTTPPASSFNQQALLANIADKIITPTFEQFYQQSLTQVEAVDSYCQLTTAETNGNATDAEVNNKLNEAKDAWRNAMNTWQQAEVMKVGPLAANDGLLRDKIYSWPVVSTCSVDFEVVNFRLGVVNGQPYNIADRTPNRRGLAALEYLLFTEQLDHSCTSNTQPDNWDSQTEDYRKVARCEFALEVASDISNNAQELVTAWTETDGYATKLKQAGTSDSGFATEHQAINEISDGMFYLDLMTKDRKIAKPLGLFENACGEQVCLENVESNLSENSVSNILNNLLAFQKVLTGDNQGVGFTDYLIDVGDQVTADTMVTDVALAISSTQAYNVSLTDALTSDKAKVEQTHTEIKAITDKLKADFITSLALELPNTAAGDND